MQPIKTLFVASLTTLFFIVGCGTPYLERGFKSEADYVFAQSANLSPIGVERFKSAGVSDPSAYHAAVSEMHTTGYSTSNDVDDVLEYVRDRFEGAKTGTSALQRKNARIAEAARRKAEMLEAERLEAKRLADEKTAKEAKRAAELAAQEREIARKRTESKNYVLARKDALKKSGVYETDVLDLIVNYQSYKGKKVFLKCWINNFDSLGGHCRSKDDKQFISIENEGIDKNVYKWLLENCRNYYYKDNDWYCQSAPIVGTVEGSSIPRLTNVYIYELCKNRTLFSSSAWKPEFEGCSLEE